MWPLGLATLPVVILVLGANWEGYRFLLFNLRKGTGSLPNLIWIRLGQRWKGYRVQRLVLIRNPEALPPILLSISKSPVRILIIWSKRPVRWKIIWILSKCRVWRNWKWISIWTILKLRLLLTVSGHWSPVYLLHRLASRFVPLYSGKRFPK